MIRDAIGRIRRSAPTLVAIILTTSVVVGYPVAPVNATGKLPTTGSSSDEQQRVNQIIAELDRLGEQIDALGEDYSLAVNDMEDIAIEIKNTEKRIAEKEAELATMQGELKQLALKTFTHGGLSSGLSSILGSTSSLSDIVRKKYLTGVALNTGVGNTDALQGVIDDLAKERATLEKQKKKAESAANFAASQLDRAEALAATYEQRQAQAERELGAALRTERQRREAAALDAAQAEAAKFKGAKYANVAPASSKAGSAIRAALSQLGVRYRFGSKSPGVSFDCSGLTSWAWGVAGVGIPRTSRTQYAGLNRIPTAAIQPGDLIFSGYPIHHVAMYLGNGQMVHAPRTGDVVKVSAVYWSRVVGVVRPR
jgi:cell wall-associated NlpC family hydrolase